jgi:hypothetical protein
VKTNQIPENIDIPKLLTQVTKSQDAWSMDFIFDKDNLKLDVKLIVHCPDGNDFIEAEDVEIFPSDELITRLMLIFG